MKSEIKTFSFKLDSASSDGVIQGYASTFGNMDQGFDIVEKGAFTKTLKESKGLIPILDSHDASKQIGWNMRAKEDETGLFVEGQLDLNTQGGREKYSLAKKAVELGAKMGLSIGYWPVKAEPDSENRGIRRLKELKLYEYSLVTFPMNVEAQVTAAKQCMETFKKKGTMCAREILEYGIKFGLTQDELKQALAEMGAAESSSDPDRVVQSLDKLIKLMKT